MKKYRKKGHAAAVLAAAAILLTLTGCGQTKEEALELKYREKGIVCMNGGDYEDALENFDLALGQAGKGVGELETDICFYKAQTLYLSGDKQAAMDLYTALIDLSGEVRAYYLRGRLYLADSETALALNDFEQAVAGDGENVDLLIGISESLDRYGLTDRSQTYLTEALELIGENPKSARDQLNRGRVLTLLGEYDAAENLFKEALGQEESTADFYLYELYKNQGKEDEAAAAMEAYIGTAGADPEKLTTEGMACLTRGDYEQAVTDLEAALELQEKDDGGFLLKNTIIANEYAGNFSRALELAESYTEQYPDDEEAQKELIFLQTRS